MTRQKRVAGLPYPLARACGDRRLYTKLAQARRNVERLENAPPRRAQRSRRWAYWLAVEARIVDRLFVAHG